MTIVFLIKHEKNALDKRCLTANRTRFATENM